jgi:Delta3-Delta2-enoyl-CoA isomerase
MIETIPHGDRIVELRIARAPINLVDVVTLRALRKALADAASNGTRGVLISGMPGVFSSGVDIIPLLEGNRAAVHDYWHEVFMLAMDMAQSKLPIVSAITGHCLASGALLAIFCDYRVMAQGPWSIGLAEIRFGVALPECFQFALRRVVGSLQAERMLVFGRMLDPKQALAVGLVDELAAPDEVVTCARERLQELLAMPRHSLDTTRAIARADLAEMFADADALPIGEFVDAFLLPETQAALRQVARQLRARMQEAQSGTAPIPA